MQILMVCMQHDYGEPARGLSYEHYNFALTLSGMGHDVRWYDYMAEMRKHGRAAMNEGLVKAVKDNPTDLAIFSLYTDQLDEAAVNAVRQYCKTFCFFHDDNWRVAFSRAWAPYFDCFSSSDFEALHKYSRLGLNHVVHMPFGANTDLYKPLDSVTEEYEVTFVGGWHPVRAWLVGRLQKAGVSVRAFGHGWSGGIVDHAEMVRIFNASAINLNLSNSTTWDARYLLSHWKAMPMHFRTKKTVEQIKARHFEINACRAFQLSYYVEGLERCFDIGREIAIFNSPDELVEKVRYYLEQPDLRREIAQAAYQRTVAEHSYQQRFNRLFAHMGLIAP